MFSAVCSEVCFSRLNKMSADFNFLNFWLLIVDDSPINHRVVTLSLKDKFAGIDSAYNGQEGIDKYRARHYDVILMDARMPVMDGFQATSAIRSYEKEEGLENTAKIVAMTASDEDKDIDRCLLSGMDAYLGKPFSAQRFLNVLKKLTQK